MKLFTDLLTIKRFREGKAERELNKQRIVLASAVDMRNKLEAELRDYQDYAMRQEQALFDALCMRTVRLRAIEDVQQEVAQMRSRQQQYVEAVAEAEMRRLSEDAQLQQCRSLHQQARRAREKLVEIAQVYADEARNAAEKNEENEIGEVAELRRERVDWEEYREDDL